MSTQNSTVTPGNQTSEFQVHQSTQILCYVAIIIGLVLEFAPAFTDKLTGNTGLIVGAILQCLGVASKLLSSLGYTASRTSVKVADSNANASPSVISSDQGMIIK